ncbi:MAG: hypothetical protein J0M17_17860 [Planctomycetes bacterium]|nr:hypothetical protein [Planctomycetota bacterium]
MTVERRVQISLSSILVALSLFALGLGLYRWIVFEVQFNNAIWFTWTFVIYPMPGVLIGLGFAALIRAGWAFVFLPTLGAFVSFFALQGL